MSTQNINSLSSLIKQVEQRILEIGPNPVSEEEKAQLNKLKLALDRAKSQRGEMDISNQVNRISGNPGSSNVYNVKPSHLLVHSREPLLGKEALKNYCKEIDPNLYMDEDVQELLMKINYSLIKNVVDNACKFALHRNSKSVDVKDVLYYADHMLGIKLPGFSLDNAKVMKKTIIDSHRHRLLSAKRVQKN